MRKIDNSEFEQFSRNVAKELIVNEKFTTISDQPDALQIQKDDQEVANIDLTPFIAKPQPATASKYFASVESVSHLLSAYEAAKSDYEFENDLDDASAHVSVYAGEFLQSIFHRAKQVITDQQASLIGSWLTNLDVYTAVKSVESLLNSKADIALLE